MVIKNDKKKETSSSNWFLSSIISTKSEGKHEIIQCFTLVPNILNKTHHRIPRIKLGTTNLELVKSNNNTNPELHSQQSTQTADNNGISKTKTKY